jgi:cyclopropane fatty-acyl-phospholipid synthase-like methyltransferase
MEGLRPTDTLVDFGCVTGRLAVHAVSALIGGRYIGIDISQSMLDRAGQRIERLYPAPPCDVSWRKLTVPVFPLDPASVDMLCAFSVFTTWSTRTRIVT